MKGFRAMIAALGPKWFVKDRIPNGDGSESETDSRILYSMFVVVDALDAIVRRGMRATMPGLAPEDALQYIGKGLRLLRGPDESADVYAQRLSRAWDDWRLAGLAWGMLEQLRAYCYPHAVRVRIVTDLGNTYTIDRDGTRSFVKRTAWDWDHEDPRIRTRARRPWSRFWVLIYPTTGTPKKPWDRTSDLGDADLWENGAIGEGNQTIGSTASPADVFAVRRIVRTWKPAGGTCVSILIVFDDTAFDPTDTAPPLPDGTWHDFGRYGVTAGRKTPARSADAIYWRGTGEAA